MMLDYEWGNPAAAAAAAMLLFGDEGEQAAAGRPPPAPALGEYYGGNPGFFAPPVQHLTAAALFSGAPVTAAGGQRYGMGMPTAVAGGGGRMGLNLGVRTYFSSVAAAAAAQEEMVMTGRVCRRRVRTARCQAEGCGADLTHAKHYHRRHKVCEFHSKASIVIAAGLSQRFCQQCSRFHVLSEFDQGKRSCRKRLADHNRRRRKSQDLTATTISSAAASAAAATADDSINYSSKQQLIVRDQFDASSSSNNNCIPETGGSTVTRAASPPPSVPAMALALGCGGFALSPAGLSGSSSTVTSPPRIPFFSHLGDFRGGHEHRFLGWDDGDDGSSIRSLYDQTK